MDAEPIHDNELTLPTPPGAVVLGEDRSPTREEYAAFELAYRHFSRALFDDRLTPCLIVLDSSKPRSLGWYSPRRYIGSVGGEASAIALNPSAFATTSVMAVLSTLVHEMAHHFQALHGKPGRGRYHNSEFARIMEDVGLQCSATGKPYGPTTGDSMSHYAIEGGRFLDAAQALLSESRFTIPWHDRFAYSYHDLVVAPALKDLPPQHPPAEKQPESDPFGIPPIEGADHDPIADHDGGAPGGAESPGPAPIAAPAPPLADMPFAPPPIIGGGSEDGAPGIIVRNPNAPRGGRSTRTCFVCACAPPNRAWGKPSLHIRCLDCDTTMRPMTSGGVGAESTADDAGDADDE